MTEKKAENEEHSSVRRKFMVRISLAMGGLAAAAVGVPIVGSVFGPLLEKVNPQWRQVGILDDFEVGTTSLVKFMDSHPKPWSGTTAKTAAWLRRDGEKDFKAFSVNCTHLGCPVRWVSDAELFLCPCHGGVYYRNGDRASGPPPKGLPQYPVRVRKGIVEVKTSPVPITNINAG